jgi:CRP-like cAMP-binding protein
MAVGFGRLSLIFVYCFLHFLPTAFCVLLSAFCNFLPTAFRFLLSAFYFLLFAYCFPLSHLFLLQQPKAKRPPAFQEIILLDRFTLYSDMTAHEALAKAIETLKPVSDEGREDFLKIWSEHRVKRKEIITAAGEVEKYLYFVTDGIQRIVYQDDQNRESTLVFSYAPSFGGVINSFFLQKPSRYFFESLTPSAFLRAPFHAVDECMRNHPTVSDAIRIGLTEAFSGLLERMVELQCFSSEEKFRQLLKRSPHILTLVPHKYLANYLGIDPTNFSKLINSVKI